MNTGPSPSGADLEGANRPPPARLPFRAGSARNGTVPAAPDTVPLRLAAVAGYASGAASRTKSSSGTGRTCGYLALSRVSNLALPVTMHHWYWRPT